MQNSLSSHYKGRPCCPKFLAMWKGEMYFINKFKVWRHGLGLSESELNHSAVQKNSRIFSSKSSPKACACADFQRAKQPAKPTRVHNLTENIRVTPGFAHSQLPHPAAMMPHPAAMMPHPAAMIPHPAAMMPHPAAMMPHPAAMMPHPAAMMLHPLT